MAPIVLPLRIIGDGGVRDGVLNFSHCCKVKNAGREYCDWIKGGEVLLLSLKSIFLVEENSGVSLLDDAY